MNTSVINAFFLVYFYELLYDKWILYPLINEYEIVDWKFSLVIKLFDYLVSTE